MFYLLMSSKVYSYISFRVLTQSIYAVGNETDTFAGGIGSGVEKGQTFVSVAVCFGNRLGKYSEKNSFFLSFFLV